MKQRSPTQSPTQSPTPALPQREGAENRTKTFSNGSSPSLWGRAGVGLLCFILFGCITEYEPTGIDEIADILVVDGIITDDETCITLSRSINLTEADNEELPSIYIHNAKVYVECDDGTQMTGEHQVAGQYLVQTGTLNLERKYRLKIEINEHEYSSNFSYPIATSEIDSIFWMKRDKGEPVTIHVATQSSEDFDDNIVLYYLWSFEENWEIRPPLPHWDYPSVCWYKAESTDILLGSATKTVSGSLIENINEIDPSDRKLSEMYQIMVKQNAISKRAYDYFSNIRKNSQHSGSIFSPIPLELTGNITCTTDPGIPVIGYVEVSTTTQKHRYISRRDNLYEPIQWNCQTFTVNELREIYNTTNIPPIPPDYTLYQEGFFGMPALYVKKDCVECNGKLPKPDDWPNR